ncbi:hypothetical protein AB3662_34245 [Sorangium cellulosum]|uniref:hypothetical protein n=1 Tax=Sorangium cellulosum TaxID=56 RepID=UPI003D9A8563
MSAVALGVAAESVGDVRIVQTLVDRVLIDEIDWVAETFEGCRVSMEDGLSPCRSWRGVEGSGWLDLHRASDLARERGLRIYGSFAGEPGEADARMRRAALLLFAEEDEPPAAVVIARDLDGRAERAEGFAQAVAAGSWPFDVVIGALPVPEIEAWLIAAWMPEDDPERKRHAALRGELHFDPCTKPEQLTSKSEADRKDAKRVLEALTTTGRGALERWADVPLERLEAHGGACGLARFVREVRERLVPIVESG